MYRLILILLSTLPMGAEIVDRIAITVGHQVVTELQLEEEIRVTAFLNHQPVARDLESRRAAADRLIEQLLVKREMELSHYPLPGAEDANNYFEQVQAGFGGEAAFEKALADQKLNEETLKEHLGLQLTTLRFIELRFRPDADISDEEIRNYYRQESATWKTAHPGAGLPTLDSSRESIRKTLIEQRRDDALNAWLEESRKQVNIVYLDKSLQ
jgi:hypothetical protein